MDQHRPPRVDVSLFAAATHERFEDSMSVAKGCGTILNRWSIWSTVQHSPGVETLLAVELLYFFQSFVLSNIHIEAGVPLSLPIVDHFAYYVSA